MFFFLGGFNVLVLPVFLFFTVFVSFWVSFCYLVFVCSFGCGFFGHFDVERDIPMIGSSAVIEFLDVANL